MPSALLFLTIGTISFRILISIISLIPQQLIVALEEKVFRAKREEAHSTRDDLDAYDREARWLKDIKGFATFRLVLKNQVYRFDR
jgi:hypothetical protein